MKKIDMYGNEGDGDGGSGQTQKISIQYLKSKYNNYPLTITENIELDACVVANDRFGTFSYTLVVVDETGGIEIKVSGNELFTEFPVGQEVKIRCKGLVLGSYGGVVQMGTASADINYETSFIPASSIPAHIVIINKPINYAVPTMLTLDKLEPKHVSSFVLFKNVQFVDEELGRTWSDPDEDTDRHIIDASGDTLIVRTSRNATFAKNKLPYQSGQIEGILSYFNKRYQLRVYTSTNVVMESPRFTPQK